MVFILIRRRLDCDTPSLVRQARNGRRGSISWDTNLGADKVRSCSHQSSMTSSSSQAQRTYPRYVACEGAKKPPRSASAKNSALLDQNAWPHKPKHRQLVPNANCKAPNSEPSTLINLKHIISFSQSARCLVCRPTSYTASASKIRCFPSCCKQHAIQRARKMSCGGYASLWMSSGRRSILLQSAFKLQAIKT